MTATPGPVPMELALRVCDGVPVDWDHERALHHENGRAVQLLEALGRIARAHRHATLVTSTVKLSEAAGPRAGARPPEEEAPERWGPLVIREQIGGGSFGRVFRAFDGRLQIDVALKLFRMSDRASADHLLAEARALARVRHPNVLAVRGADEFDACVGMWTDLLHGRTLEQILMQDGPMGHREAASIGIDLCRALAAVHTTGFVHGDVKTSNVMREVGGRIVLMDFGTALDAEQDDPEGGAGSVGTPAAMAPEQLLGAPATRVSDIYALGVLLYRLVSGRLPVEAGSLDDLRARHARGERVPLRDRRPDLPEGLVEVIEQALHPDPAVRWRSAGEMERALIACLSADLVQGAGGEGGIALTPAGDGPVPGGGGGHARSPGLRSRRLATGIVLAAVVTALAVFAALRLRPMEPSVAAPLRVSITLPPGHHLSGYANVVISPDGRSIVYAADDSTGSARLWVRRLDAVEAHDLPGTEGAFYPFWAPDGNNIAFFSKGSLKRTSIGGGRVQVICPAEAGRGGSWSVKDVILFAPGPEGPLYQVPATGGEPVPVTRLARPAGEIAHRWPCWLPNGRDFLYLSLPPVDDRFRVYSGSLGSDRRVPLGLVSAAPRLADRRLVYLDGETLVARSFDPDQHRFKGDAVALADAERFEGALGEPQASVSRAGALVFASWGNRVQKLIWVDRATRRTRPLAEGPMREPRLSPDGTRVVVDRGTSGTQSNVWMIDARSGEGQMLTTNPARERFPLWSADGGQVLYASNRSGRYEFYVRDTQGSTGDRLVPTLPRALLKWPTSWVEPRSMIAYAAFDSKTGYDVWLRSEGDSGVAVVRTPASESDGALSPDGRWLAYQSNATGKYEIFCRCLSNGETWRLSKSGGVYPRWRGDGRELYFYDTSHGSLAAVAMPPTPGVASRDLVPAPDLLGYDVDPAGERFLLCLGGGSDQPEELTVLLNWPGATGSGR